MTNFVTYNDNQFDPEKLNLAKGSGAKIQVELDKIYNLENAPSSDKVTNLILTPYGDGYNAIVKPIGEIKFPATAYILSKVILKGLKFDPTVRIVTERFIPENEYRDERNKFRSDRPRISSDRGSRQNNSRGEDRGGRNNSQNGGYNHSNPFNNNSKSQQSRNQDRTSQPRISNTR